MLVQQPTLADPQRAAQSIHILADINPLTSRLGGVV